MFRADVFLLAVFFHSKIIRPDPRRNNSHSKALLPHTFTFPPRYLDGQDSDDEWENDDDEGYSCFTGRSGPPENAKQLKLT